MCVWKNQHPAYLAVRPKRSKRVATEQHRHASERRTKGEWVSGERVWTFCGRGKKEDAITEVVRPCAPCCCLSFWLRGKSAACVEDHCRGTHKRKTAFIHFPDPFICPVPRLFSLLSLTSSASWLLSIQRNTYTPCMLPTCQKPFDYYIYLLRRKQQSLTNLNLCIG